MELVDLSRDAVSPPTFGASLRATRLSRNISLETIAAHTKINRSFFQDLERNDLSKWPSNQFYRESYLRAYAEAIGLNPHDVIDGFRRELAAGEASSAAAPSSGPRRLTPVTIPIILAVTFIVFYSLARWFGPGLQQPAAVPEVSVAPAAPVAAPPVPATTPAEPSPPPTAPRVETPAAVAPAATEPLVPKYIEGALVITSTPPGATVLVNGINRGRTPVDVRHLPPGSYTIRLIHAGHASVTQRVTISAERPRVEIATALEPIN